MHIFTGLRSEKYYYLPQEYGIVSLETDGMNPEKMLFPSPLSLSETEASCGQVYHEPNSIAGTTPEFSLQPRRSV
jgi:hypothetical protein